ncbi:MAG: GtrA family protein [Candidatus Aminicenantes bacterium]
MIKLNREFLLHFVKYSFVGILNAILTFLLYFILLKIFHLHYLVSLSVSWLLGVLLTYVINFLWVFKPEQKLVFKSRLLKYFVVYVSSYLLNIFLLKTLTELTGGDPLLVQLFILPVVVAVNFAGIKYWCMIPGPMKRGEDKTSEIEN